MTTREAMLLRRREMCPEVPMMGQIGHQTLRMEVIVILNQIRRRFVRYIANRNRISRPVQQRPLCAHRCAPTLRFVSHMYQIHIIR